MADSSLNRNDLLSQYPSGRRDLGVGYSRLLFPGLSDNHLKDAVAEFALYALASGANLAYGGDLRDGGFAELMFDLVLRYPRSDDADDV